VHGFEGILGVAIGIQLDEADVGQIALDHIGQTAVCRCRRSTVGFGQGVKRSVLGFEMAQNVMQPLLDPSDSSGTLIGGSLQAFEQILNPLFEMFQCRRVVVAHRHAIEEVRKRKKRISRCAVLSLAAGRP